MQGRRLILHSQLSFNRSGAVAHQDKLLLRQGENDMACGHYCVLMALMLLGVISRDDLYEVELHERLLETCLRGQSRYFAGCSTTHIKEQIAPFVDQVQCRHLQHDIAARTVEALESDHVCLIRFSSDSYTHWVLAVGLMYADDKPHTLLGRHTADPLECFVGALG